MIGQDPVRVDRVVRIDGFTTQRRMPETKTNKLLGETVKVLHPLVSGTRIQSVKKNQVIRRSLRIICPLFVFQKFLSHKEHGNTWSRQQNTGGHARSAPGEK